MHRVHHGGYGVGAICAGLTGAMQVAAANGQSAVVSVIQRDAGLLERGSGVRLLGMNLVVADFFDAGGPSFLVWSG